MPDLLHVVPISHDAVFDWIFKGKDAALGLSLITVEIFEYVMESILAKTSVPNVTIFLAHSNHDTWVSRMTNNRAVRIPI